MYLPYPCPGCWLFPFFDRKAGHWFVVQVDFRLEQIVSYDSLPAARRVDACTEAIRAVQCFVAELHLERKQTPFHFSSWGHSRVRVCDQSGEDWYNCGVFAFITLWCLARRAFASLEKVVAPPSFDAPALRARTARWRERLVLWLRMVAVPA